LRKAREEIRMGREKDHDDVDAILGRDLPITKLLKGVENHVAARVIAVASQLKISNE
jgi:hypothetical protein